MPDLLFTNYEFLYYGIIEKESIINLFCKYIQNAKNRRKCQC